MPSLLNRVMFNPTAGGLTDFVVASAVVGFMTPAQAGVQDQFLYPYFAQSGDLSQWEVGIGTYTVSTTTLARTTIQFSSNSNAAVNFTAAPMVAIDATAAEFRPMRSIKHRLLGGI